MFKYLISFLFLLSVHSYAGLPPTSTRGAGEANYSTTFKFDLPYFPLVHNGTAASLGILTVSGGGTNLSSYPTGGLLFADAPQSISAFPIAASSSVLMSDGSAPAWASGDGLWANRQLSNLGTTAINADLIPDTNLAYSIGDPTGTLRWQNIWGDFISFTPNGSMGMRDAVSTQPIFTLAPTLAPDGTGSALLWRGSATTITSYPAIGLSTRNTSPQRILIQTGNGTGVANTAAIHLRTGTATGGFSRGEINLEAERLTVSGMKIVSMGEPTTISDAATKYYVDTAPISFPRAISGLAAGDILYASSSTVLDRLPIGTVGQTLTVSGAGFPYWSTNVITALSPAYISISASSSPPTTVGVIYADASSGPISISVPDPASMANQLLFIKKSDTSPNVVSLSGGITTHPLYSPYEQFLFHSTGSSWEVLNHLADYCWAPEIVSLVAVTAGPNPTNFSENKKTFCRNGNMLHVTDHIRKGSGGSSGTGLYYVILPTAISHPNVTISSSVGYVSGAAIGVAEEASYKVGTCHLSNTGTHDIGTIFAFDPTRFQVAGAPTPGFNANWGSATAGVGGGVWFGCNYQVPMNGWEANK